MTEKEEDWEKCLRWLKHATGDEKFWKYDLDKVQEERELYKLLKDGVLLSRLMRWKKQDSLSDKTINYNTNNISTLEQANIKIFIDDVQKFYKIINIFEKHGPSVFKSYADFYIVLKGLSKLSYKWSPKQYFTIGKKLSEKRVTGEEELTQELDESEYLLYITSNYYEEKTCKNLTQSMEELPRFHRNNLEKVLKVIHEFYVSLKNRSPSNLLITQLLPTLRIKELINIHEEFDSELEIIKIEYEKLFDIFDKYKDKFLLYCDVMCQLQNVICTIQDKLKESKDFQDEIVAVEREIDHKYKHLRDCSRISSILTLVQTIAQHIPRFPLILADISKKGETTGRTRIRHSAEKAYDIMFDLVSHMERYAVDNEKIGSLELLKYELKLPSDKFNTKIIMHGGRLKEEYDNVEIKDNWEDTFFRSKLLIFEKMIIVMKYYTQIDYKFLTERTIEVLEFKNAYYLDKIEKPGKIQANTRTRIKLESFQYGRLEEYLEIYFPERPGSEKKVEKLLHSLEKIWEEVNQKKEKNIKPGLNHNGHNFEIYEKEIVIDANIEHDPTLHIRCDDCKYLLRGKIQFGIYCRDHNKIYHLECFQRTEQKPVAPYEPPFSVLPPIKEISQFDCRDLNLTRQGFEKLLKEKKTNTFLLRLNKNGKSTISVKSKEKFNHYVIEEVELKGSTWLYLEKGTASTDLLEMIEKTRDIHSLYHPFHSPESAQIEESEPQDTVNITEIELGIWEDFCHPPLTNDERRLHLSGKENGTFLLCVERDDKLYLYKWNGSNIEKYSLEEDEFKCIALKRNGMIKAEKSTLSNLIQACQAKDSQEELFLGCGVISADAQRKVKSETRVKEMEMEPWSLTGFVGEMDKNESKRVLSSEPRGTYLIRLNQDKEYRLAVKTETGTINNFKINYENGKYHFLNWEESSLTDLMTIIQRNHIQYMTPFIRKELDIPVISKSRASYVLSFHTQGSYLVRKNEEGKLRISYKKNDRIKNMIVGNEPGSLRKVIEELKNDGSITNEIFDDLPQTS